MRTQIPVVFLNPADGEDQLDSPARINFLSGRSQFEKPSKKIVKEPLLKTLQNARLILCKVRWITVS